MHRWFEQVWNQKNEDAIDEMFAEDGIGYGLGPEIHGPADFKPFFKNFISAYPDIHVEVLETITAGDKVAARCHVTGTHQGHGLNLAPTGERRSISPEWSSSMSRTASSTALGMNSTSCRCTHSSKP